MSITVPEENLLMKQISDPPGINGVNSRYKPQSGARDQLIPAPLPQYEEWIPTQEANYTALIPQEIAIDLPGIAINMSTTVFAILLVAGLLSLSF